MTHDKPALELVGQQTIPVVHEQLRVDQHTETTGVVRVRIEIERRDISMPVASRSDEVVVRRVQRGVVCEERVSPYYEGDDLVIPVYSEVPVTTVQLMLVEEIRVRRESTHAAGTESVSVQEERATIERLQPDGSWKKIG